MNSPLSLSRSRVLRAATILALVTLLLPATTILNVHSQSYNLKYDLGYSGTSFPGGVISVVSNFTNTGQLTIRVTSISFASDFWSNGTRQVTSGFPFNLTTGSNNMINTAVLIPASASLGSHGIRATASWQYSNSSGWYAASPIAASITVTVSQTLDSLLSTYATILLIGLGIAGIIVISVVLLVIRRRRKRAASSRVEVPKPN